MNLKFEMPELNPEINESMKNVKRVFDDMSRQLLKVMDPYKAYNFECHREGANLIVSVREMKGGNLPKFEEKKVVSRIIPVEIAVPIDAELDRVAATIESVLQQAMRDYDIIQAYDLPEANLEPCDVVEWKNGEGPFEPDVVRKSPPDWKQMTFKEYQDHTGDTAKYPGRDEMIRDGLVAGDVPTWALVSLLYVGLGLGEAGELQNKIKKIVRDGGGVITPERREQIASECGDALWYLSELANLLGLDLGKIAKMNLDKLAKRKAEGKISGDGDKR